MRVALGAWAALTLLAPACTFDLSALHGSQPDSGVAGPADVGVGDAAGSTRDATASEPAASDASSDDADAEVMDALATVDAADEAPKPNDAPPQTDGPVCLGLSSASVSAMVADTAPAELRGTAFGLFNLAAGVATLAASGIAGLLWQGLGSAATFLAGAGFAAAALLLIPLARRG